MPKRTRLQNLQCRIILVDIDVNQSCDNSLPTCLDAGSDSVSCTRRVAIRCQQVNWRQLDLDIRSAAMEAWPGMVLLWRRCLRPGLAMGVVHKRRIRLI